MKRTRFSALLVVAGLALLLSLSAGGAADKDTKETPIIPPRKGESKTLKLFNGKDLDGWEGHKDLWSVQDSAIVAKNTKPIKVSTYLERAVMRLRKWLSATSYAPIVSRQRDPSCLGSLTQELTG